MAHRDNFSPIPKYSPGPSSSTRITSTERGPATEAARLRSTDSSVEQIKKTLALSLPRPPSVGVTHLISPHEMTLKLFNESVGDCSVSVVRPFVTRAAPTERTAPLALCFANYARRRVFKFERPECQSQSHPTPSRSRVAVVVVPLNQSLWCLAGFG